MLDSVVCAVSYSFLVNHLRGLLCIMQHRKLSLIGMK